MIGKQTSAFFQKQTEVMIIFNGIRVYDKGGEVEGRSSPTGIYFPPCAFIRVGRVEQTTFLSLTEGRKEALLVLFYDCACCNISYHFLFFL